MASRFAAKGDRVVGVDLHDPAVDHVDFRRADVTRAAEIAAAVTAVGPVDVLVMCAGVTSGSPVHETSEEEWRALLDLNLTSVFLSIRAVLPHMLDAGGGAIVAIGSVLHRTVAPGLPAYAAAKAGVAALIRQVAVDYGRRGITAVTVSPGWTDTPATRSRLDGPDDRARLRDSNPLGLLATPDDIADTVVYAASPLARLITGAELVLDAGASVVSPASLLRDGHRRRMGLPDLR